MRATTRSVVVHLLVALAALALGVAARRRVRAPPVVDSDQFANRATAALQRRQRTRRWSPSRSPTTSCSRSRRPVAARPLIESARPGVVGGRAFTGLFRSAVRDVHRALVRPRREHGHADGRRRRDRRRRRAREGPARPGASRSRRPGASRSSARPRRASARRRSQSADADPAPRARRALLVARRCAAGALALSPDRRADGRSSSASAPPSAASCSSSRYGDRCARSRSTAVDGPDDARGRGRCGTRSSATCAPPAGSSPAAGAVVAAAAASLIRPLDRSASRCGGRRGAVAAEPQQPRRCAALRGVALVAAGVLVLVDARRRRSTSLVTLARRLPDLRGRERDPAARLPPARAPRRERRGRRGRRPPRGASPLVAVARRARRGRGRRASSAGGGTTQPRRGDGRVQRPRRAVRPAAGRGRARRRPTTRCPCRCPAGTRPSRSGRSPTSSRTASAAC